MTKFFLLIALALTSGLVFAQTQDQKAKDNTTDDAKPLPRSTPSPDFPGEFILDYGLNYFTDQTSDMTTRPWQSPTINIYYAYPFKLGESRFSFNPAIGLGIESFAFEGAVTLYDSLGTTLLEPVSDLPQYATATGLTYSKMTSTYVDIPLEFRVHSRKLDHRRSWILSVGMKVGFCIDGGTKVKYTENGTKKLNKNKYSYNLSNYRYGPVARLGYGPLTFWGYYRINKMFQGNKTEGFNNPGMFSFGISIATF